MAQTWTTVKGYGYTKRALEAWMCWRFALAISQGGVIRVKPKDGNFNVYAPEGLSTGDKRALRRALEDREDWYPPAQTWEEFSKGA